MPRTPKDRQHQTLQNKYFPTDTPITLEIQTILKPGLDNHSHHPQKWLTKKRDAIMVVAVLIAFQAGGVWQENLTKDSHGDPLINPHRAGEAVMAYNHPQSIQELHEGEHRCIRFISQHDSSSHQWAAVQEASVHVVFDGHNVAHGDRDLWHICGSSDSQERQQVAYPRTGDRDISLVRGVMGILLNGNTARLIDRWLKNKGIKVLRPRRFRKLAEVKHVKNAAGQENVSTVDEMNLFFV